MPGSVGHDRRKRGRGFRHTGALLAAKLRAIGESRGFAVSRVLTHWAEIAGPELAACTRPVEVTYGRQGLGATLTILTTGAHAPLIEMQKDRLRERINACYGYAAISRIRITQTAATGFAEGGIAFEPSTPAEPATPSEPVASQARAMARGVDDEDLRLALSELGANILSKPDKLKGRS